MEKKNIFVIGSWGYNKNYGGWETFVKNFCDYYDKEKANIYVSEPSFDKDIKEYNNNGIVCNPILTRKLKSATMPIYSIKALKYYINYVKENDLKNSIFLILGLKMGPFLKMYLKKMHNLDIKVFVNPDGLEWKRSKWGYLVKKYFLYAEKSMLSNCDGIICDSLGIKEYLEEAYPKNKIPKYFAAYGTSIVDISNADQDSILEKYKLKKDNYCLMVTRCVPENNIELVINEFMKSKIDKKLVIICNLKGCKYYDTILKNTNCNSDKRIIFIPGVYNKEELTVIRKNAYLYIHGHCVGGTNPSLLEAMSITNLNILYDVNFNKEVGKNACLYFSSKEGDLKKILDNKKNLEKYRKSLGSLSKKRIKEAYTWDIIVKKYENIFK